MQKSLDYIGARLAAILKRGGDGGTMQEAALALEELKRVQSPAMPAKPAKKK